MMKRSNFFFIFPFLLSLMSCDLNDDKITVYKNDYNSYQIGDNIRTLSCRLKTEDLEDMIENNYSFPLLVIAPGCGTCDSFSQVIEAYIKKSDVILPVISLNNYLNAKGVKHISSTSLLIYKDGKLKNLYEKLIDDVFTVSEFEKIISKCIEIKDVQIVSNIIYPEHFDTAYPSYQFYPSIRYTINSISLYDRLQEGKVLLIDETKIDGITIDKLINDENIDYVCFISADINRAEFKTEFGPFEDISYKIVDIKKEK